MGMTERPALTGTVVTGEVHDRPTVDVSGLDVAEALTVGPDEVLVLLVSQYLDPRTLMQHRATIETALPPDRYLVLQGWKLAKVSLAEAERYRELERGSEAVF